MVATSISPPMIGPELINPMERTLSVPEDADLQQREQMKPQMASPSADIIGEGAAIFTDMTETILDILDKQVIMSPGSQQIIKEIPNKDDQKVVVHSTQDIMPDVSTQREDYPDLFLPIRENYRISDHLCGYSESLSADNNPMVLVEMNNLSYRYGTSLYAVDRVNGTMYGKFSMGYRMIPEKATVIPQYQHTTIGDEHAPAYENTLPGITSLPMPIAKSTPVTYASHMPTSKPGTERDILQPISSEEARTAYLEGRMKNMGGVQLPLNIPSKMEESHTSADLARRIDIFCKEQKDKRRQEWESHQQTLNILKERKSQQCKQPNKESEVIYSQIAQEMEKTRDVL